MRILSILPSCSAITWAIWASDARLVDGLHRDAGRKALRRASSTSQRTSSQRSGVSSKSFSAERLDRIDGDALARGHDADDAVARHGAAVGREAHRQIAVDAADRDRRPWSRRPAP